MPPLRLMPSLLPAAMVRADVEPIGSAVVLPAELLCWCCTFTWCWNALTPQHVVTRVVEVPTATPVPYDVVRVEPTATPQDSKGKGRPLSWPYRLR